MLPLEATGIRFNLPSQVLSLGCRTILSQPDVLQGNLVFARHLPHHRTERKLTRFADDDSACLFQNVDQATRPKAPSDPNTKYW